MAYTSRTSIDSLYARTNGSRNRERASQARRTLVRPAYQLMVDTKAHAHNPPGRDYERCLYSMAD